MKPPPWKYIRMGSRATVLSLEGSLAGRKMRAQTFVSSLIVTSLETVGRPGITARLASVLGKLLRRVNVPSGLGRIPRCWYGSNLDMVMVMVRIWGVDQEKMESCCSQKAKWGTSQCTPKVLNERADQLGLSKRRTRVADHPRSFHLDPTVVVRRLKCKFPGFRYGI
ncbi:hypothetical protein QQP08_002906 [Theobroma cacao]|nr:hypothetical protein QQP08_002906 [Theobroma cacao]